MRGEDDSVQVPHLDAGDLFHRQTGDRNGFQMTRRGVRKSILINCLVHIGEKVAIRRCETVGRIALQPAVMKSEVNAMHDGKMFK